MKPESIEIAKRITEYIGDDLPADVRIPDNIELGNALCEAIAEIRDLQAALKPFADFADKRHAVPGTMVISNGSAMARTQLTMADCYRAAAALESAP